MGEATRKSRFRRFPVGNYLIVYEVGTDKFDPLSTYGFENYRGAKLYDLCSLANDQNKAHHRQRDSSHRRYHAGVR